MQQVYQKDTAEAREALAALFETHTEAMMPLLNIVVVAGTYSSAATGFPFFPLRSSSSRARSEKDDE